LIWASRIFLAVSRAITAAAPAPRPAVVLSFISIQGVIYDYHL